MKHYRRSTSCWLICQALCFCLLLQGTGIAQALPLPPKKTFVSEHELESARLANLLPNAGPAEGTRSRPNSLERFTQEIRTSAEEAGGTIKRWLQNPWPEPAASDESTIHVAQAGGILPLPPGLISAFLGSTSQGHAAPPSPTGLGNNPVEKTPPAELVALLEKTGTDEIPLLAGWNLISIPKEPADLDPAAVFGPIAGQTARAEAFDACDLADPWKLYDPADPAASDLTVADHKIGMWVQATSAAILPSGGTLPDSTTIDLCEGWNLIGFPTGEPRHPHAALSSIAGKWQRIFSYDAFDSQDPWEVFSVDVPDWANDLRLMQPGRGYWVLATEAATLEIRNEGPPPTVAIASPADLAVITQPTEIIGTVESDRLDSWTLTYRPIGDGDAVTLATSNAPVLGGTLGTFDPTLLLNGLYELELTATDIQGQQVTESIAVAVEGQMKIGHFTLSFVDLAIPVSGLDIEIVRTYDSRDKQQRDFGIGWSLDIRQGSYSNNRAPGDGWQLQDGFVACDTALESKSHLTVVRLSGQEVYRFALRLVRGAPRNGGGCSATAEFVYVDGPIPGASLTILGNDQVFQETPSSNRVLDPDTFATYEPQQVRLTTRDGRIFELDLNNGVTLVEDLNGNQLSISPAGITHSSGKGIVFERDSEGRIERITDPMDRVMTYGYDTASDLVSFTDRAGAVTRFTYEDHRLRDIEDPRGIKPIRNEYDAEGRVVRHIDAFGNEVNLGHDLANRREVVTNRLGASRVLEHDARGNVVRETDERGKVTQRVFDGRDNLLSETDPLGRTATYTYTANDDLETLTNPLGYISRYTYDGRGQLLTITDPRAGVTTRVYDRGNLTSTTDALGKITTFTYYSSGNLRTTTDALGHVSTFEYDGYGNLTRETDALGNVTDSTYDAAGNRLTETRRRTLADGSTESLLTTFTYDDLDRLRTTTAADGSTISMVYDLLGKVLHKTNSLGRTTTLTYDLMGRLIGTTYPGGTNETLSYDAEGRLLTQVDRAGRTAGFTYDAAGRLKTTTYPDGGTTSNTYDDAGQLVATTDARGNTTTFVFDDVGRRTAIIDPYGKGPTFTYDDNGNQESGTDARGFTTGFIYDALNRLTVTTHPDQTTTVFAYDDLGRRIAETDQAGHTTAFGYDALGRLKTVTDALDQVTSYTYDEVGNRLTQTDANRHTTRFEYDALGRQIARILPDDSRESMIYNLDGTRASHTDFNGTTRTFTYDVNQRLTRRAYSDGSEVSFTYTPTGQRETVIDSRGTTSYAYDSRDRLTEKTDPTGFKLGYGYDLHGNRTRLTATVGAQVFTTTYTYDDLNRVETATDSSGGVTGIGYDDNGNRESLAHPNDVTTIYSYDAQSRLEDLSTASSVGDVLASYSYTLGPAGNRTRIDEHDGTSRNYEYDDLYRLTQDRVIDPAGSQLYRRDFIYDPVGNRRIQTIDEGGELTTITSAFDTRDRLATANTTSYGWDDNGNLTSKTEDGASTYSWDHENRLTSVTLADGTIAETTYDADGNRVRTVATTPGGETAAVDYLVDTEGLLSHVVADVVAGSVQTLYSRIQDQLIGFSRPGSGESRYFHTDGVGSVRLLSDDNGTVIDSYSYTAFGEPLEHIGHDPQPYRFAGEPFDPNAGFYYHRARWRTATGQFLSTDPFHGFSHDPRSLHQYAYAASNPQNLHDPSGRSFQTFVIGVAVRVVLFTMAHPFLTAGAGLITSLLIPQEFSDAFAAASGPYGTPVSTVARGRASFFAFVKGRGFRNFVKHNRTAAGKLWQAMGQVHFEKFVASLLQGEKTRHVLLDAGKRSADLLWRSRIIEVKTGRALKGRELEQLDAIAAKAGADDLTFAYQFLVKPTQPTIDKIKELGGQVLWLFETKGF